MVMSGTEYHTGKSNRISQQQFHELKVAMQEYQKEKYPALNNSLPNLSKSKSTCVKSINAERCKDKNILTSLLETIYSKSNSLQELLEGVKSHGHEAYYRNGRLQGIKYNGERKFRLQNLGFKEKLLGLDRLREQEAAQMQELSNIRGRQNERSRLNEMPKTILYENEIKGMNEDQVREYQQGLVNRHMTFEKSQIEVTLQNNNSSPIHIQEKEEVLLNDLSAIRERGEARTEISEGRSIESKADYETRDDDDENGKEDNAPDDSDDEDSSDDSDDNEDANE